MVSWMRVVGGMGALLDLWYVCPFSRLRICMLFRRNIKIGIQVHLLYLVDLCSAQPTYLGMQPPISDVILPVLRVPVVQVYVVLVICYPEI